MEGLKIRSVTVTPQACMDILTTGIEAGPTYGIGYWAEVRALHRTKKGDIVSAQLLDREGAPEGEEPERHSVTLDSIAKALSAMLRDPVKTDSGTWGQRIILDDGLDGPLADAIIQVACFGKVIYG